MSEVSDGMVANPSYKGRLEVGVEGAGGRCSDTGTWEVEVGMGGTGYKGRLEVVLEGAGGRCSDTGTWMVVVDMGGTGYKGVG